MTQLLKRRRNLAPGPELTLSLKRLTDGRRATYRLPRASVGLGRVLRGLDQPPLGEAHDGRAAHDEVVEHADLHHGQRVAQSRGDQLVGLARLRDPARVVVREDHRGGVELQRPLHDLAGMHRGAVDGAQEHLLDGDQPVAAVEEETAEHLALLPRVVDGEVLAHGARAGQHGLPAEVLQHPAPDQLAGGPEPRLHVLRHGVIDKSPTRYAVRAVRAQPGCAASVIEKLINARPGVLRRGFF